MADTAVSQAGAIAGLDAWRENGERTAHIFAAAHRSGMSLAQITKHAKVPRTTVVRALAALYAEIALAGAGVAGALTFASTNANRIAATLADTADRATAGEAARALIGAGLVLYAADGSSELTAAAAARRLTHAESILVTVTKDTPAPESEPVISQSAAARQFEEWNAMKQQRDQLLVAAHRAGVNLQQISEHAGLARTSVYRILAVHYIENALSAADLVDAVTITRRVSRVEATLVGPKNSATRVAEAFSDAGLAMTPIGGGKYLDTAAAARRLAHGEPVVVGLHNFVSGNR